MKNSDSYYEERALVHAETVKDYLASESDHPTFANWANLHAQLAIAYANLAVAAELDWANNNRRES